jgi:hypothetical protein
MFEGISFGTSYNYYDDTHSFTNIPIFANDFYDSNDPINVDVASGGRLDWDFTTSGAVIFYIIDGYNEFDDYRDYNYFEYIIIDTGSTQLSGFTTVSKSSTYYLVIENDGSSNVLVTGSFTVTQPPGMSGSSETVGGGFNFSGIITLVVVVAIIGGGIFLIVRFSRSSGKPSNYLPSTSSTPGSTPGPGDVSGRTLKARSATTSLPTRSVTPATAVISTPTQKKFCTKCGATIKPGDTFCTSCGAQTSGATASTAPVSASKPSTRVTASSSCAHCGALLADTDKICPECSKPREKCEVCKKGIRFGEEIGTCMHCYRVFHYGHLKETVKVTGKCPACRAPLKESDIDLQVIGKHK